MLSGITGIICAMDSELELYRRALEDHEECGGFLLGRIGASRVALALCNPGKVNAALCAQAMLDRVRPDRILNTGIAGAVAPDLKILDTVIAKDICQHDLDTTPIGDPLGEIPGTGKIYLPCDVELSSRLFALAEKLGISARLGTIASGDQFIANSARKQQIRDQFHAECCEMESGAIGQVCYLAGVPYTALRVISDPGEDGGEMSFTAFMEQSSHQSAQLLIRLLQA